MDDARIDELAGRARGLVTPGGRALLGITGAPGAGKSTVTRAVVDKLRADGIRVAWVPMDGFHFTQAELVKRDLRDVMGRIDTFDADGYLALLSRLRDQADQAVTAPDFDRNVEEPVPDAITVGPEVQLVVTEGNYLLDADEPWPAIRATLDEVWFVETHEATRVHRLLTRHVEFGKTEDEARRWMARVDEPNAQRVQATRGRADLVVDLS
jgi:pantothenate kinase